MEVNMETLEQKLLTASLRSYRNTLERLIKIRQGLLSLRKGYIMQT